MRRLAPYFLAALLLCPTLSCDRGGRTTPASSSIIGTLIEADVDEGGIAMTTEVPDNETTSARTMTPEDDPIEDVFVMAAAEEASLAPVDTSVLKEAQETRAASLADDPLAAVFAEATAKEYSTNEESTSVDTMTLLSDDDERKAGPTSGDDPIAAVFAETPARDSLSEDAQNAMTDTEAQSSRDTVMTVTGPDPLSQEDTAAEDSVLLFDMADLVPASDTTEGIINNEDVFDDIFEYDTSVYVKLKVEKDISQHFNEGSVADTVVLPENAIPTGSRETASVNDIMRKVLMLMLGLLAAAFLLIALKLFLPDRKGQKTPDAMMKKTLPSIRINGKTVDGIVQEGQETSPAPGQEEKPEPL